MSEQGAVLTYFERQDLSTGYITTRKNHSFSDVAWFKNHFAQDRTFYKRYKVVRNNSG